MGKKKGGTVVKGEEVEEVPPTKPEPTTTAAAAGAAGAVDATLKKKKKKKKKKKSATAAAAAAAARAGNSSDEDDSGSEEEVDEEKKTAAKFEQLEQEEASRKLDPVALAIYECVRMGHQKGDVEAMVNDMFDRQVDGYDDPVRIIEELHKKHEAQAFGEGGKPTSPAPSPKKGKVEQPKEVKAAVAPTPAPAPAPTPKQAPAAVAPPAAVSAPPAPQQQQKKPPTTTTQDQKAKPQKAATPAAPPAAPTPTPTPAPAPKPKPQAPLPTTLAARLELAASNEDSSILVKMDAIAGFLRRPDTTPEDRQALLSSRTLELLFQGVLKASLDAGSEEKHRKKQLAEALADLLRVLVGSTAALDDILSILGHAQGLHGQRALSPEVLTLLSQTLASSLKEFYAKKDGSKNAGKELSTLEAALRQAVGGNKGLPRTAPSTRELFELRDKHAHVMDLQQQACRLVVDTAAASTTTTTATTGTGKKAPSSSSSSFKATDQVKKALVDAVLKDSLGITSTAQLQQKRKEIATAKTELSTVHSAMERELAPLVHDATQYKDQLLTLRARRETLAQQLAAVEAEIGGVQTTLKKKEEAVSARRAALEASVAEKDRRLQGMLAAVRRADEADELAEKVQALTSSLAQSLTTALAADSEKNMASLRKRVRAFAAAFEPYLGVETKCVEFLQGRVAGLQAEQRKAAEELAKYQSLGTALNLSGTIQDLTKKIQEQQEFITQDNALIAHLLEATQALFASFREAVECAGGTGAEWIVNDSAGFSLVGVKQLLDRLGLAQDWLPGLSSRPVAARVSATLTPTPTTTTTTTTPAVIPAGPVMPPAPPAPASPTPIAPANVSLFTSSVGAGPTSSPPGLSRRPQQQQQQQQQQEHHHFQQQQPPPPQQQQPPRPPRNPTTTTTTSSSSPPIKFSWANRVASPSPSSTPLLTPAPTSTSTSTDTHTHTHTPSSPTPHKSLVQIQEEERQSQLTEENLRRLEQSKATPNDTHPHTHTHTGTGGGAGKGSGGVGVGGATHTQEMVGSSEAAEVNSMTDRTLGAATVSSEGMQELSGLSITGAGVATPGGASVHAHAHTRRSPEEGEEGGEVVGNGGVGV